MAQTFNLSRSTKFYVSTVNAGWTTADTFRINVLDGYALSQDVSTQEVGLSEAGPAPVRGQKIFNTALNPADFSITTYMRPFFSANHNAVEKLLWEAMVGTGPVDTNAVPGATAFTVDFENSDVHELLKLFMYFELDSTTYRLDNAILTTAEIDFSIDGIAQVTWSGQAEAIVETTAPTTSLAVDSGALYIKNKLSTMALADNAGTTQGTQKVDFSVAKDATAVHGLSNGTTYTVTVTVDGGTGQVVSWDPPVASTNQDMIDEFNAQVSGALADLDTNGDVLVTSQSSGGTSSIAMVDGGVGNEFFAQQTSFTAIDAATAGTGTPKAYNVAITGGTLTLENNVTFLTPEELGIVNTTIGSFTGTRAINGNVTAYLRTGASNTGGLLSDMVSATSVVTHNFSMTLAMGGITNTPRVELFMPHAHLVIPAINVEDVVSVDIGFSGLGQDISQKDEIEIKYIAQ